MSELNDPIARAEPLVDQVYRFLRQEILTGQIDPGTRIVESKVAKQLSISRSPVREAIRRLEQDGLVNTELGITMLFHPSHKDFEDLYELRLAVEPMAAQLAAKHMPSIACQELEAILQATEESLANEELDCFIEHNTQFHNLIVEGSNNKRLQKVMHEITALSRYYRYFFFKVYHRRVTSIDEHWQIHQAILERKSDLAWERMKAHIEGDLAYIQSIGQQEGQ